MSAAGSSRAKEIFMLALEQEEGVRAAFVERSCAGDEGLRARVLALLSAHARAEGLEAWVASPPQDPLATPRVREALARGGGEPPCFGDYEILGEIASGASGTVYSARQKSLGRVVALKMLRVGRFATESEVRRFRAEAEAAARLDHPGLVPVYEVGEHEGRHYFSMKRIGGPSLAAPDLEARRDARAAARLLAEVARAVHHAHTHGLLHRDLKPSNILLDESGRPYVADFGIAKRMGESSDATQTGWIRGTPAYMAPEQAEPGREETVASDVYSLGSVLYELLAGRPPFVDGSLLELLERVRAEEPARFAALGLEVERDLETIVRTCLAKDPARRYPSALALAEDLERWLEHRPIQARPVSAFERTRLFWRRRPLVASLSAAIVLLVLALAVGASVASWMLAERLERAREAEASATERLRASLLAQARAERRNPLAGRRGRSLELLAQAAAIAPGPELRDEAITAFSQSDLSIEGEWRRSAEEEQWIGSDRALERAAFALADGGIVLRALQSGAELARLPAGLGYPWIARFVPESERIVVKYHRPASQAEARWVVWDLGTGRPVLESDEFVHGSALDVDPSGRLFAVGVGERACVRSLQNGEELLSIALDGPAVTLRFAPDGGSLAVCTLGSKAVLLHRIPEGERSAILALPSYPRALAFGPDGSLLAAGCSDFRTYVLRVDDGAQQRVLSGHQAEVTDVLFGSADLVATYSWDETSRLFELATGELVCVAEARARAFSPDGHQLAFTTNESVGLWRVERGEAYAELFGHEGKSPIAVAIDPAGELVASGGADGLQLRAVATGELVAWTSIGELNALFFVPSGALYASGERGLRRWPQVRGARGELGLGDELLPGPTGRASASADGTGIAAVQGASVRVLHSAGSESGPVLSGPAGMDSPAFGPDGARVAVGSWRGSGVRIFDARSGALERVLIPEAQNAVACFTPDGATLITGTPEEYRFWRVADWELVRSIARPRRIGSLPGTIAVDAAGARVALARTQRLIDVYDARGELHLATLGSATPRPVVGLAFLPERAGLAVASGTGLVQLWRLEHLAAELERLGLAPPDELRTLAGE